MILVVAGDDLGNAGAGFTEDGEVADQVQEAALLKDPLNKHVEFGQSFLGDLFPVRGAPGHGVLVI